MAHRLAQRQEARPSSPRHTPPGDADGLELRGWLSPPQPALFRTARGRGRDLGVFGHHAPYTCPGPVARVTKRAPLPRPCPVRLS